MDPKSAVVKSKSSNSAITSKDSRPNRPNKKTRSNADVLQPLVKKRGVYVEKKLTKISLENHDKTDDTKAPKPPKRVDQKEFLTSVLTILSKPTTGTQYPEIPEDINEYLTKGKKRTGFLKRNKQKEVKKDIVNDINETKNRIALKDDNNKSTSHGKFKSRVLKKLVREDRKKMVVLQSKKDITQTPSNYSEWSYKDATQSNTSNLIINDVESTVSNELANAVMEGRNPKKFKKLRYVEEPQTLVSDQPKDEKKLYNFFVDLLETTISVYNVKAEYDGTGELGKESKVALEINESVADKLVIDKGKEKKDVIKPSVIFNIQDTDEDEVTDAYNVKPITIKPELVFKDSKPKKLKADSFIYAKKKKPAPQKSKSVEINHKVYRNKNDLINVLKQELELNVGGFEEPKSIYQALKVMARNKKKSIRFDTKQDDYKYTDECYLKGRKVISTGKSKRNRKKHVDNPLIKPKPVARVPPTDYKDMRGKKTKIVNHFDNAESYHSLEVYGFEYETTPMKKQTPNAKKDITYTYHSSPSNSELDFNVYDAILNPCSEFSMKNF